LAGIYIHIPFCRQACRYCDFHFNISLKLREEVVSCIIKEIIERKHDLNDENIETIYFGGGTPSVLTPGEIEDILKIIYANHNVSEKAEISFEANPDDLKPDYLRELKKLGINRLSIGIQSFFEKDLELLRRSHTAEQSLKVVSNAINAKFDNINIDLIYGIPGQDNLQWRKNIDITLDLDIQHISAYHLTYESGTVLDHWRKKGRIKPVDEDQSLEQLEILIQRTAQKGFEHYEISNFARPGFISKHNANYWRQVNYSGIGPSAHSYNGKIRRWNVSNNLKYIQALQTGKEKYFESEELSRIDLYNEYILTSLRTIWGIDLDKLNSGFGRDYTEFTSKKAERFIESGKLEKSKNIIRLTNQGILVSDYIISEFFILK
jgi:oxygen-independent coproporphyrinogen III oxidase